MTEASLVRYFASEAQSLADAGTRCGRCVEVCRVVPFGAAATSRPEDVGSRIVGFLSRAGPVAAGADSWVATCNGCGTCIPACPEGINPRKLLVVAATKAATTMTKTPEL